VQDEAGMIPFSNAKGGWDRPLYLWIPDQVGNDTENV